MSNIHDTINTQYLCPVSMIDNTYHSYQWYSFLCPISMISIICVWCPWYMMFTSGIHDTQFFGLIHDAQHLCLNPWYSMPNIYDRQYLCLVSMIHNIMSIIQDTHFWGLVSTMRNIGDWHEYLCMISVIRICINYVWYPWYTFMSRSRLWFYILHIPFLQIDNR